MKTLTIEIPVVSKSVTTIELELPFFGQIPGEKKFLKIDEDLTAHTLYYFEFTGYWDYSKIPNVTNNTRVNIPDYAPVTEKEWNHAVCEMIDHLEDTITNLHEDERHIPHTTNL